MKLFVLTYPCRKRSIPLSEARTFSGLEDITEGSETITFTVPSDITVNASEAQIVTINYIKTSLSDNFLQEDLIKSIDFNPSTKDREFSVGLKETQNWVYNTQIKIPTHKDIECNDLKIRLGNALVDSMFSPKNSKWSMENAERARTDFESKCPQWTNTNK